MEKEPGLQQLFFEQIRNQVPDNLSFVHEIASLLEISYDSAYRRIRGEKELSLEEMLRLGEKFSVSLDSVFNLHGNNVVFRHYGLQSSTEKISEWLPLIYQDFLHASKAQKAEIIYAAKDPPIYQYFQFPEIAAFKFFFWKKTLFENPGLEDRLFRLDDIDSADLESGAKLLKASINLPTTEIWNEDTFNMFCRQIEYYWVSGYFEKKDDMLNIVDKLEKWVRHMQKQADNGFKFIYGQPAEGVENSFLMYENEVVLNDNTIFARVDNITSVYITYNVISLLISHEPRFCADVEQFLHGLTKKSNLISLTGSKARNRFFNKLQLSVEELKKRLDVV
jgi:plasmid maintenance system antidote protein VapI